MQVHRFSLYICLRVLSLPGFWSALIPLHAGIHWNSLEFSKHRVFLPEDHNWLFCKKSISWKQGKKKGVRSDGKSLYELRWWGMASYSVLSQYLCAFWMPHDLFPMKTMYLEKQELRKTQVASSGSCGAICLKWKQESVLPVFWLCSFCSCSNRKYVGMNSRKKTTCKTNQ